LLVQCSKTDNKKEVPYAASLIKSFPVESSSVYFGSSVHCFWISALAWQGAQCSCEEYAFTPNYTAAEL